MVDGTFEMMVTDSEATTKLFIDMQNLAAM